MPVQKLDIYDVIVDVFPGIITAMLTIILLAPLSLLPEQPFGQLGVSVGILFLALFYILGRLVHGIASGIDSLVRWATPNLHTKLLETSVRDTNVYRKLSELAFPITGPHYTFEQHMQDGLSVISPFTLKTTLAHELITSINESYDVKVDQIDNHDLSEVKNLSYSILYNKDVLYRKYEILATFFRSLYVVFFAFTIFYSLTSISVFTGSGGIIINQQTIWSTFVYKYPGLALLALILMLVLFIVFLHQRRKFSHRRGWALIYDTVNELKDDL